MPGSVSEYFVQAVDENGNVGLSTFKGIAQPVTAAGGTGTAVGAGDATPATQTDGWYTPGANVTITSATGETFRASVDGGPADPVGASGIDLTTDGTHVVEYTGSAGSSGTVDRARGHGGAVLRRVPVAWAPSTSAPRSR